MPLKLFYVQRVKYIYFFFLSLGLRPIFR